MRPFGGFTQKKNYRREFKRGFPPQKKKKKERSDVLTEWERLQNNKSSASDYENAQNNQQKKSYAKKDNLLLFALNPNSDSTGSHYVGSSVSEFSDEITIRVLRIKYNHLCFVLFCLY